MTKLPAQKFFAYSDGKPITYEWQPPEISTEASTDHLADIYQHFRGWILQQHGPRAPEVTNQVIIDDLGVRSVLKQALIERITHLAMA